MEPSQSGEETLADRDSGTMPTSRPPGAHEPPQVGAKVGRYVLTRRLGAGSMGVVFAAEDPGLGREVAIKILAGSAERTRRRQLREARAMAQLAHPNVITVHDAGLDGDKAYIAMDLIEGGTLWDWQKRADQRAILRVYSGAAAGLAAAHAAGLVHADFKPQNVLIDALRVVVADFGLAHSARTRSDSEPAASSDHDSQTTVLGLAGTPAYMAPERIDQRPATPSSDQFSFCVALYEALTGAHPFEGSTAPTFLAAIAEGRRRRVAHHHVPRWLLQVLDRGLAADPSRRWPSMRALVVALDRGRSRRIRLRWYVAGASTAALLVAIGLWPRGGGCDADEELAGVWAKADRSRIEAQLKDVLEEHSRGWPRLASHFDKWAADWRATYERTCAATLQGRLPADAIDLRMRCLRGQREQVRAILEIVESSEDETRAFAVATNLPALSTCAEAERMYKDEPLDAEGEKVRAELRAVLAEGAASLSTGRFDAALEQSKELVERAQRLGSANLEAEAHHLLAGTLSMQHRPEAVAQLDVAYSKAVAAGRDDLAAASAMWAARASAEIGAVDEAERWLGNAKAAKGRLPEKARRGTALFLRATEVEVAMKQRDLERADAASTVMMDLLGETPPNDSTTMEAYDLRLAVLIQTDRLDEASELLMRLHRLAYDVLGPDDIRLLRVLAKEASFAEALGELDKAEAFYVQCDDLLARVNPEHAERYLSFAARAGLHARRGEHVSAIELYRRARELASEGTSPEHEVMMLVGLGASYRALDRFDDAETAVVKLRAFTEAALGGDGPWAAYYMVAEAALRNDQRRYGEARAVARSALELRERHRASGRGLAVAHLELGRALAGQGLVDDAVTHFRRSIELLPSPDRSAVARAHLLDTLREADRRDPDVPDHIAQIAATLAAYPRDQVRQSLQAARKWHARWATP